MDGVQLGSEFGLSPEHAPSFRTKASAWRGLVAALEDEGLLDAVCEQTPAPVTELLRDPPTGGVFVPAISFHYVYKALEPMVSDAQMRAIGQRSMHRGPIPLLKPVLEALFRLLGTNPGAVMRRMPGVIGGQVKGMKILVDVRGEKAVDVRVSYDFLRGLPRTAFTFWQGILWTVFDLCRVEPTVAELEIGEHSASARFHFEWA